MSFIGEYNSKFVVFKNVFLPNSCLFSIFCLHWNTGGLKVLENWLLSFSVTFTLVLNFMSQRLVVYTQKVLVHHCLSSDKSRVNQDDEPTFSLDLNRIDSRVYITNLITVKVNLRRLFYMRLMRVTGDLSSTEK